MINDLINLEKSLTGLLNKLESGKVFARQSKIIIKPNLVGPFPPPVTTDVKLVVALIKYIRNFSNAKIIVAEGSGECETAKCFKELGYLELNGYLGAELIDLDTLPIVKLKNHNALLYKEIYLPKLILDGFLISVPVLKDHSITGVSLGIKNLIGLLPASKYSGYWSYRKSEVHRYDVNKAIVDICLYRPIDMVIIDAAIGQKGSHLPGGEICDPPTKKLIASFNPLEADIEGAQLLGHDWKKIKHLALYNDVFTVQSFS